jgi:hypothetical protein
MKKWSPTHLQPIGVPCCQRSSTTLDSLDVAAKKKLDGYVVYEHHASTPASQKKTS